MSIFKRQNRRGVKFNGQFLFSNFDYGLYKQEVPRTINEQLASLALTGGRNVWNIHGALTTQYGYEMIGKIDEGKEIAYIPEPSSSSQNLAIGATDGSVYRYNTFEGVKAYKTEMEVSDSGDISCYDGARVILYDEGAFKEFGGRWDESSYVPILDNTETRTILPYENYLIFSVTQEDVKYFWVDKLLTIPKVENPDESQPEDWCNVTVTDITPGDNNTFLIRVTLDKDNSFPTLSENTLDIGERTYKSLGALQFIPEDYDESDPNTPQPITIVPKLLSIVLNRMWVVATDNKVYYSATGQPDNFNEAYGAGYFYGFYNDTSPVLSVEEYYSGALITKQNGMYHAKITTNEYSFSGSDGAVIGQSTSGNYINITKLNNIPQKTAGDHCIIGDEVIAYDITSGNICQAVMINYFGNPQQGSILLHGSELDAENLGLYSATNRKLCYNFQEEVLMVYYSSTNYYTNSLVIPRNLSIYPREISDYINDYMMFQQGIIGIDKTNGLLISDFKRGTTIPNISSIAEFEPIYLNGNRLLCGTIVEVTELNNEPFDLSTANAGISFQHIEPTITRISSTSEYYPNMVYSNTENPRVTSKTVAREAKWTYQKSSLIRAAAPLGGRNGLTLRVEFEPNVTFQIVAINLPDFSVGE